MTGHVFVVASGFGKRVIPTRAPFTFRVEGGKALTVRVGGSEAIVETARSVLDAASSASGVADVIAGPARPAWWLDTSSYRLPLPQWWTAHASGSADPSVFDLVGPGDSTIYVQVPRRVPPLDKMIAPGQHLIDRGSYDTADWIAVSYSHEGVDYVQRHAVVRDAELVAVVTLQCPYSTLEIAASTHEFLSNALQHSGEQRLS